MIMGTCNRHRQNLTPRRFLWLVSLTQDDPSDGITPVPDRPITQREPAQIHPPAPAAPPEPPNVDGSRLRHERLLRGWTQREVADLLFDLCTEHDVPAAGLTADTVGRWERGMARPSHRYRKYLCQLFGLDAVQLDLLPEQRRHA